MKALAIVALAAFAGQAHADTLFATENNGALLVNQLAGNVMTVVYEEPSESVVEYAFSDPKTLWVLRAKQGKFSIGSVVAGKAGPERVLTYKDWGGNIKGPAWPPHLLITKSHQVWVTRCLDSKLGTDDIDPGEFNGKSSCEDVYRRIDADAPLATSLGDVEIVAANWQRRWPHSDRKTAPKGYTVTTDTGFVCKGPRNKLTLQLGTRWARDEGYVSDDPVILRFTVGKASGGKPIPFQGHDDYYAARDIANDDGTGMYFLEDCKTHLRAVIAIEPGVIATTEGDKTWRLRRGDKDLATFTSTRVVAP